jgi:3'-phosphoadenosine 5'-phosphosulfate sulfotransferase (PAPS reductase)/FAD synthetase
MTPTHEETEYMSRDAEQDALAKIAQAAHEGTTLRLVGFSGGVDSQACAWWVRQQFPPEQVLLLNSDAGGNEHPMTTEFVAAYSRQVFPVVTVTAQVQDLGTRGTQPGATRDRRREFGETDALTFDRLAYIKQRFPSRKAQFCTEHLKLMPQKRWIETFLRGRGVAFERYIGVRCDESALRATTPASAWDTFFGCQIHYPVRCWTKPEVFAVLKQAGEPINPLYTLGFNRVGCAPCINNSKQDILNWAIRFPEMIDKVRTWEQRVGRTFFAPIVPGLAINWIDEVVAWARTSHGGKQFAFVFAPSACESKYGLCDA